MPTLETAATAAVAALSDTEMPHCNRKLTSPTSISSGRCYKNKSILMNAWPGGSTHGKDSQDCSWLQAQHELVIWIQQPTRLILLWAAFIGAKHPDHKKVTRNSILFCASQVSSRSIGRCTLRCTLRRLYLRRQTGMGSKESYKMLKAQPNKAYKEKWERIW